MEDLPELICRFLPDTTLTYVNKAYCRYLGKSQEELVGHSFLPFLSEEYQTALKEHLASLSREDPVGTFEERVRKPDGEVVWQQWINRAVYDEEGNLVEYHGVGRDLSAQELVEEALLESEERYRNLADASFEGVAISEDGEILYANLAFANMFGYESSEIRGREVLEFKAPEKHDLVRQKISSGSDEPYEAIGLKKDGTRFPIEIRGKTTSHGGRTFRVSALRDLSERKKAEKKLKQSEELYRTVVEDQTELICRFLPDGTLTLVNDAYCRYFSKEREELIGESFMPLLPEEDREEFKEHLASLTPENTAKMAEHRVESPSGEIRWQQWTDRAIFDEEGYPVEYQSVGRDITERKAAEARLRESEERFRTAFEDAPIGVALVGLDMRYLRVNHALCEMLGYPQEELLKKTSPEIIHPDDHEVSAERVRQVLEEGLDGYTIQRRYIRGDGRVVRNLTSVSLIRNPEGEPGHFVCLHQDVTEREEAEEFVPTLEKLMKVVHPDDRELVEKKINAAFDENEPYDFEHRIVRPDGEERVVHRRAEVVLDEEGEPLRMIGTVHDITERKEAEEALRESEEFHRAVMEQSVESIYLFDPETKCVLEANATVRELLGYTSEEFLRMTLYDFIVHDKEDIDRNVERNVLERQRYVGEREYRHKDGSTIEVEASATMIPYYGREVVCVVVRDVTERKELEEQLRYQAFHDSLTELPNRALFLDRLEHALAASERSRESVAVLFLDLDDFKVVNDSMGHEAGNRLLVEAAERLQTCVRPGDTVGRIFGDEFAVLLQAPADVDEARQVTERIVERLQRPFSVDGRETYVSCSVGITQSDPNQEDQPKEVLRRADLAMYAAKSRGKDAYEVYNPSMNERAIQRMELENDLRRAVEREEFEVHYQPIVRVSTGEIDGFEALARWKHPERGFVAPEEFIDLAEETGLIRPIGRWVFEEACRQACRWREQHPERKLRMGVNFSTSQFSHQADTISEILSETGLDPSALQLEITERSVMDNAEFAIVKLQKLKNLGIQFAIDDYGTGYSCLYYLKHMPVDSLKIDRSFVAGLGENPGDTAIVSGTIDLAHALGLKVVAEGIEDERQLAKLKELGCDLAQGYHFAEPLPSEGAERLLKEGFSC